MPSKNTALKAHGQSEVTGVTGIQKVLMVNHEILIVYVKGLKKKPHLPTYHP